MGIPVLIIGESGTGKSTSLRNLPPDQTLIIQSIKKPLPFRNEFKMWDKKEKKGSIVVSDNVQAIDKALTAFPFEYGKKIIIIDDFQYIMANEFMRRSDEKGYGKFTDIAKHAWEIIMRCQEMPDDVIVYFLSHSEDTDSGKTKAKTIGKLLDDKITLEGLFTIVMRSMRIDGQYLFSTQNNGNDTVKTPMGLFEAEKIENDLNEINNQIKEYYGV